MLSTRPPSRLMGANKPPAFSSWRAPGKERQRAADEETENAEDENAARRIDGEGMNRSQDAGAHEEGADQRQREGQDGEQHGPDFQRIALFDDDGRMQQRGGHQPGHEAGVFHRVPEPPAAPAQFVIGPPAIPWRCRWSGTSRRRASMASPSGPRRHRPCLRSGPQRQRKRQPKGRHSPRRERADGRRAPGPAGSGLRPLPSMGDGIEPREGIGGHDDEEQEGKADGALHRQHAGLQFERQIVAEERHGAAERLRG